ncbi:replication protein C, IncQ-type, partial [Paraburkholderia sp. BR10937]|uniref:replication protein C, IncQ-type n=1 Tax=Paraburkholderia sp. BR10937 TaxID=3236994 RepID=UPI0034D1F463
VREPGFFSADCVKVMPIRLGMMGITLMSPSATVYNGRHEPLTAEGGSAAKQIRRELMRMSEVTIWAVMGNQEFSSRLLHWRMGDGHGAQVILNARLTEILIGRQYSPVSLQERLALKSDIARALHCALSVRIRPAKTMSFNLDTLAPYVWCEPDVADATVRRRRQQLRAALCELDGLRGWSIRTRSGEPLQQADSVHICRKTTKPGRLRTVPSERKPTVEQLPSPVTKPGGKKSQAIADVSSLFA